ncbi:MAG TPA: hypothetical protein VK850_05290 [Candidatus Binatia bacterium]|nr:hypothetical protein [Candidatus Binatia bacterium]
MKINSHIQFRSAILFAFLCLTSARAAEAPAPAKADTAPGHVSPYISVFTDNRTFGKDPFFPKSRRREITPVAVKDLVLKEGELPQGMVLKGLSGTKEKQLAIINNYTFAEGEEAEVRIINILYRVKVIEIKERSVIISVNGTTPRELAFRHGL